MRKKRPATVMMRVRKTDLNKMKEMAKAAQKQLPDFQRDLIKFYRKKK